MTIVQFLLTGIIGLVILQILIAQEYNTIMLYIALSLSYGLWIVTLGLLAKAFFSWYTSRKNLMVLLFALSMVAYVINGVFGLYNEVDILAKRNSIIRSDDVAIFPEFPSSINMVNQTASSVAYVLTWIATVMLLRPYIEKLGNLRFWSIMGVTMAYYVIQFPLFTLGYFTPSENSNAMTNILIFSLSAIFTGILFGVAFLSVARLSEDWYCHQELHDNSRLWHSTFLHRRVHFYFSSRFSSIWTCFNLLCRFIMLFDIQWP